MTHRITFALNTMALLCVGVALPNVAVPQTAKEELHGVWKLTSWVIEDSETKERKALLGEHPKGYLILLPTGRMAAVITPEGRRPAMSDEEQAAAFRSLYAYSGKYRLEGSDKFITKVEVAWNEAWVGTDQVRHYKVDGDKLNVVTPNVVIGGRTVTAILSWEREK